MHSLLYPEIGELSGLQGCYASTSLDAGIQQLEAVL
jgi:hypothetical protein